jgi:toxin-antitoxin system PIN domain toxin
VKYLADVNVLVAFVWSNHSNHAAARAWWRRLGRADALATCAITELGFVRVSLQTTAAADLGQVRQALVQLRGARPGHVFLPDALGADVMPEWVKTARQTTDGHLAALAEAHGAKLVTFDRAIPGAIWIEALRAGDR